MDKGQLIGPLVLGAHFAFEVERMDLPRDSISKKYDSAIDIGRVTRMGILPPTSFQNTPNEVINFLSRNRSYTMPSPNTGASAPNCICSEVSSALAHSKEFYAAYSDPEVIEAALILGARVSKNADSYFVDEEMVFHNLGPPDPGLGTPPMTFEEMIDLRAEGRLVIKKDSQGFPVSVSAKPLPQGSTASAAPAAQKRLGGPSNAEAITNPLSCEVKMNTSWSYADLCTPLMSIYSTQIHENTHKQACLATNKTKTYTTADGGSGAFEQNFSKNMSTTPYTAYQSQMQHPGLHAQDEAAGYAASVELLRGYMKAYCPGWSEPS